jgi:hypothetical protein
MSNYNDDVEKASSEVVCAPEREVLEAALADRIGRVLIGAPIEKRPKLFGLSAVTKAAEAAAVRQRTVDECWDLANAAGLPTLIGTTYVQHFIVAAFSGEAS